MSLAFSGSKRETSREPTEAGSKLGHQLTVCFFLFLAWFNLYPEDEGDMFLQIIRLFRTSGRYNPKVCTHNSHSCHNLKSTKINT
jgi:hypothetical protein